MAGKPGLGGRKECGPGEMVVAMVEWQALDSLYQAVGGNPVPPDSVLAERAVQDAISECNFVFSGGMRSRYDNQYVVAKVDDFQKRLSLFSILWCALQ